jgi:crotonobetainyl-CoA:carnitine CoA-transferase CaiB-like acyl-CoA transferase
METVIAMAILPWIMPYQANRWVSLVIGAFNIFAAAGRDDLLNEQFAPALLGGLVHEELRAVFGGRSRQEWIEVLAEVNGFCEPVYTLQEALVSELLRALGMLAENGPLPPAQFSANPIRSDLTAPPWASTQPPSCRNSTTRLRRRSDSSMEAPSENQAPTSKGHR